MYDTTMTSKQTTTASRLHQGIEDKMICRPASRPFIVLVSAAAVRSLSCYRSVFKIRYMATFQFF